MDEDRRQALADIDLGSLIEPRRAIRGYLAPARFPGKLIQFVRLAWARPACRTQPHEPGARLNARPPRVAG